MEHSTTFSPWLWTITFWVLQLTENAFVWLMIPAPSDLFRYTALYKCSYLLTYLLTLYKFWICMLEKAQQPGGYKIEYGRQWYTLNVTLHSYAVSTLTLWCCESAWQCGFFKRRRRGDEAPYRASVQKSDPLMHDFRDWWPHCWPLADQRMTTLTTVQQYPCGSLYLMF